MKENSLLDKSAVVAPVWADSVRNVVIVHGAFADGSGWRQVADILVKDGYAVSVVQEPLTSLTDDVAATKRVLDLQTGPTLLVGHSYGGVVITEAGNAPIVVGRLAPEEELALVATRDRNLNPDLERALCAMG
jgi:pimeloyl-ACP methyl ester carboxylesterase